MPFFREPYPAPEPGRSTLGLAFGTGLFVFLFLYVFQPFGLHNVPGSARLGATLGYGAITFAGVLAFGDGLPRWWPAPFSNVRWTVGRQILYLAVMIMAIAVGNLAWSAALGFFAATPADFAYMTVMTFLVGLFPAFAATTLNYIRFLRVYDPARVVVHDHPGEAETLPLVVLIAENDKDRVAVPAHDLLYLESADNYTQVVYCLDGAVKRTLLRGSLTRFEQQIEQPHIRRCHRSYVVNLHRVARVSGNAQGYKLHLDSATEPVPVARRYAQEVVRQI